MTMRVLSNKRIVLVLMIAITALTVLAIGFDRSAVFATSASSQSEANTIDGSNGLPKKTIHPRLEKERRPYVTAANGVAMLIDENMSGTNFLPLKTS